jgi:hypothetical protein
VTVPRDALISTSVSSALIIELESVSQTFAVSSPSIAVDILTTFCPGHASVARGIRRSNEVAVPSGGAVGNVGWVGKACGTPTGAPLEIFVFILRSFFVSDSQPSQIPDENRN